MSDRTLADLPSPSEAELAELAVDPLTVLPEWFRRFGDPFVIPTHGGPMLMTASPEIADHVFRRHLIRGKLQHRLAAAQGWGLTMQDGDQWRRNRMLMNPMFAPGRLGALTLLAAEAAERELHRLDDTADTGEYTDLLPTLGAITMRVVMHAMFSDSVGPDEIDTLVDAYAAISAYKAGLISTAWAPEGTPVPGEAEGRAAMEVVDRIIYRVIAERRAAAEPGSDLLDLLVQARYDDGSSMGDTELRDHLTMLYMGGYETTMWGLAWTLAHALGLPAVHARMVAEADAIGDRLPGWDDLGSLAYLRAAFDEGLRLQGHPFLPRELTSDDEVAGCHVPEGTLVSVASFVMHRDPERWDEPEAFRPERFLGDAKAALRLDHFVPFGGGPRLCLGMNFAYAEAQVVLALLLRRFRLGIDPDYVPSPRYRYIVMLDGGLPVRIETRRTSGP